MASGVEVVYTVAFFVLFVGPMLWLTWRSMVSDEHSPASTDRRSPVTDDEDV